MHPLQYRHKNMSEFIAAAGLIAALVFATWLLVSIFNLNGFDSGIVPQYPPPYMQEQMNRATTSYYNAYPMQKLVMNGRA